MSLEKRPGSPNWYYRFQCNNRRFYRSCETTNKQRAREIEAAAREEAKQTAKLAVARKGAPMTFDIAAGRYWLEIAKHQKRSDSIFTSIEWLIAAIGPSTPIAEIDGSTVARLVAVRRGMRVVNVARDKTRKGGARRKAITQPAKLVSAARVNRSVTELLRKILRRAERGWHQSVQKIEWKEHLLEEPEERVREGTLDEEARLFAKMPAQWHPLLRFYLRTGVREATAIALTFPKISWGARSFSFTGKGGKEKTLPLPDDIRDELWALQPAAMKPGAAIRVFRYPNGDPMTVSGFVSAFRRAREQAGITNFRPHDLRHTAATRALRQTGNLKLVQQLLTHKNIATTARYAHVFDEDLRAAMNAMADGGGARREIVQTRSGLTAIEPPCDGSERPIKAAGD